MMRIGLCVLLALTASCSSMWPLAGATIVGTGAALVSPPAAILGIPAGYAIGDLAQHEYDDDETDIKIAEIKETVEALTTGDVEALVAQRLESKMEEERGFMEGLLADLYALLKIAGIVVTIFLLTPLLYTWWRKRKAMPYYEAQEALVEELKDLKDKVLGDS